MGKISKVLAVGLMASAIIPFGLPAAASPESANDFVKCYPRARVYPLAPPIGSVNALTGAECTHSYAQEVWIKSTLSRDGVVVDSSTGHCGPGQYDRICEAATLAATDPEGLQTWTVKVDVEWTNEAGAVKKNQSSTISADY